MNYRCAQCHHHFGTDGEQPATECPSCGAEAGLERVAGVPPAMKLFGALLLGVIIASIVGALLPVLAS